MRRVKLPGTDIAVTRLSFGTASIHHLASSRRRQDVLAAAFENGFAHFDTAPYYGFGIAEAELGMFLAKHQGRVTVATKVGLYPPGRGRATTATVWLRKIGGRLFPTLSRPVVNWAVAVAEKSLEDSLRRLRVDQVDLLYLHEPCAQAIQSEEFLRWLETERQKGRIRAWGLAGDADSMKPWLSSNHPLGMVLQVRDSLAEKEADLLAQYGRPLQFTFGYLSSSPAGAENRPVADVLRQALRRNATGSIVVSTRQCHRVAELAAAAEYGDANTH
jgi:aryl-alcohol dehydrogenase-like predicted oxidoreductase